MLTETETKELAEALLRAESSEEVIALLMERDLWESDRLWRFYGDQENNIGTAGNQQSSPDQALVEKVVNGIDAVLMGEVLAAGLPLAGEGAPGSIRDAVAQFFDAESTSQSRAGIPSMWPAGKRREVAQNVVVALTGDKSSPSISIIDRGEGQTPDQVPATLLSIGKSNKVGLPFVQGKFNMGGTGAVVFAGGGGENLQLILTKRRPGLGGNSSNRDQHWSVTVVRREPPTGDRPGDRQNSTLTYLAPLDCTDDEGRNGKVLSFPSPTMTIAPRGGNALAETREWGTVVKLYEYQLGPGRSSHALRKDGLKERLDLLMPRAPLPIMLHECRDYKGKDGSFDLPLTGVRVRLDDNPENLEPDFPSGGKVMLNGQEVTLSILAFKSGGAASYKKSEGLVFVYHGQTHAFQDQRFFSRKKVGLSYLRRDLLVEVDTSRVDRETFERLFMASRDRLRGSAETEALIQEIEDFLGSHKPLIDLQARRRQQALDQGLADDKPLEELLEQVLENNQSLKELFQMGNRTKALTRPRGEGATERPFEGKKHPTMFSPNGGDSDGNLRRTTPLGQRSIIEFETDVEDAYFERAADPGVFTLTSKGKDGQVYVPNYSLSLEQGLAVLKLRHPVEAKEGAEIEYCTTVNDPTLSSPFESEIRIEIGKATSPSGSGGKKGRQRPKGEGGSRTGREGITLPNIQWRTKAQWPEGWNEKTAINIEGAGPSNEEHASSWDIYVNEDNVFLRNELVRAGEGKEEIIRQQFGLGLALCALALLKLEGGPKEHAQSFEVQEESLPELIEVATRGLAQVVVPLVRVLGGLEELSEALEVNEGVVSSEK